MYARIDECALDNAIKEIEANYIAANANSRNQFKSACAFMPGGNTRIALHYDPFPIYIEHAHGSVITDCDGHLYNDFMNDLTAGLYGHSDPIIIAALIDALNRGVSYGGAHKHEADFAAAICERFSSIERIRFCNSGTEANLVAMGVARAITNRPKVLAFSGGYHGSMANFLSPDTHLNIDKELFEFADFNDIESVTNIINRYPDEIAAIIVEPMIGSGGGILAEVEFLRYLRQVSAQIGAILIFDEVQTARLGPQGLQGEFNVSPDLTTLGKFLGGGLAFGAFGGRTDIMNRLNPTGSQVIAHGGTFNNNVLTMVAGKVGLTKLATPDALDALNALGDEMRPLLLDCAQRAKIAFSIGGFGSIISLHFQQKMARRPSEVSTSARIRKLFHLYMLLNGQYVPRRGTINLSTHTTKTQCNEFVRVFDAFVTKYRNALPEANSRGIAMTA